MTESNGRGPRRKPFMPRCPFWLAVRTRDCQVYDRRRRQPIWTSYLFGAGANLLRSTPLRDVARYLKPEEHIAFAKFSGECTTCCASARLLISTSLETIGGEFLICPSYIHTCALQSFLHYMCLQPRRHVQHTVGSSIDARPVDSQYILTLCQDCDPNKNRRCARTNDFMAFEILKLIGLTDDVTRNLNAVRRWGSSSLRRFLPPNTLSHAPGSCRELQCQVQVCDRSEQPNNP